MKAQDWMNAENYRNRILAELMEFCMQHGLSSNATEKEMVIELPTVEEINVWPEVEKRKHFDISKWGAKGIDETDPMPDDFQMPDYGETLDEGKPPKGDSDAEK